MSSQQQIIEAIADNLALPAGDIDLEASLKDDLGLNPVEIADLLQYLTQQFNLHFDPPEIESLRTVGNLVEMVEDKLLD